MGPMGFDHHHHYGTANGAIIQIISDFGRNGRLSQLFPIIAEQTGISSLVNNQQPVDNKLSTPLTGFAVASRVWLWRFTREMVFFQMHSYNDWSNASCQNNMYDNKIGSKLPKDLQGVDISDKETWSVFEYNQTSNYYTK